jgi:hypothetical protein
MDGYYGHVHDIDISLFRGAYTLKDFYINKIDSSSKQQVPFIASQIIDLSVEWKSIFHGRLVGEMEFNNSVMRFTKGKAEPGEMQKDTNDFRKILDSFMPLKINHFEIINGKIQYIDPASTPKLDVHMDNVHLQAQNLTSVRDTAILPATVDATANLYGGKVDFRMQMDPLADYATFDMNAALKNTDLPKLNDFFQAYANVDVNKGTFSLYTEIAGKDKRFVGYVKPIIKDLDVVGPEDRHDSFFNKIWERIVGTAGVLLKNQKTDQIATKIPIEGEYQKTIIDTWYAIGDLLRNAFIQAAYPSIDNLININSVNTLKKEKKKNLFQRIFSKSDKKDKKKNTK